ncbi:MAG: FAD-binding protein, partial [Duodenibacillus sp.]|nr:FAD-binding protein [Duodenibacillus sp.]
MTTRRSFIKTSLAAGALAAGSAFAHPVKAPAQWDGEYDIVIIGAGGGGMSAAAEATKQGMSVLVVEKMP